MIFSFLINKTGGYYNFRKKYFSAKFSLKKKIFRFILKGFQHESNSDVKARILQAAANLMSPIAPKLLEDSLQSPDLLLRQTAEKLLREYRCSRCKQTRNLANHAIFDRASEIIAPFEVETKIVIAVCALLTAQIAAAQPSSSSLSG